MHLFPVNDWHDFLRVGSIGIAVTSLVYLRYAWTDEGTAWGRSEKDIWYVLLMWSFTTLAICFDGLYNDLPFGPRSIFVIAASSVTLIMLIRRRRRNNALPKL